MPGVIGAAVAVATFPVNLSTKFVETHAVLANLNEYSDGSSQRKSLVLGGRRSWKLAKRLVPAEMVQLRTFWEDHTADAFNFYNPFETIPPFSRTPSGSGLYIVRFASDWEQANGMARSDASCELIEVAGGTDLGGGIVVPPIGPTTIQAGTLSVLTSLQIFNPPVGGGTIATLHVAAGPSGQTSEFFTGSTNYGTAGQSNVLSAADISSSFASGSYRVDIFIDNPIGGFQPPGVGPAVAQIYDVYLDVTRQDGTTARLRPTSTSMINQGGPGFGAITNAGNVMDGDPSTFATLTRSDFDALDFYNTFSLFFTGVS
jgi:hypothetical protein